ncbi:uncharacterized protein PAC_01247 [Phialocephala subalpina]|uniref:CHAT domain-containing protein n=1 Tax=Phialocephala subalpina TaxID=576137 RepID=A0A1L7WF13_9HELO|nr:uncharacterized protein PAC_01247 [Phialocephala subalpina]
MPFHAAGDHAPRSERNVHNRAVSSYAPSIKALAYSRERLRKNDDRGENMLLATMTTTPGLPTLRGVEAEKEAILKMLPAYLLLDKYDKAGRLVQDTMRVHSVSELKLESARIAYLSAASTAENGAARLGDEVIHLASGFQIAGFAHVVGCLWPPEDAVCVEIAKGFYGTLFKGDIETMDEDVALALHEAVSAVREMECDQPLKWAQFVHYGA